MSRGVAVIFPGQGSQAVGMGRHLAEAFPDVRERLLSADAALGFPLTELMWRGPEEELTRTTNAQPAILAVSAAAYRLLEVAGVRPNIAFGHSLGEYSALVAAGVLSFADAVRVVRRRGELMEAAAPPGEGGMAAILGLDAEQVETLCREAAAPGSVVEPATYNGPGQVVIAGHAAAIERALAMAGAQGARRAVRLNVSGPFHSSLLVGAGEALGAFLSGVAVETPTLPVIANATAGFVREPEAVRAALVRQVSAPVLWEQSVRRAVAEGVHTFIEVGPGRVLSGLVRRIAPECTIMNVEDPPGWEKVLASLQKDGVI